MLPLLLCCLCGMAGALPRVNDGAANYYIDFGPKDNPPGSPKHKTNGVEHSYSLRVDENTIFSNSNGMGWETKGAHCHCAYDRWADPSQGGESWGDSVVAGSCYDDWGWLNTFKFSLPNRIFQVSITGGRRSGTRQLKFVCNGKVIMDTQSTGGAGGAWKTGTQAIEITDNILSCVMGKQGEISPLLAMDIEAVGGSPGGSPPAPKPITCKAAECQVPAGTLCETRACEGGQYGICKSTYTANGVKPSGKTCTCDGQGTCVYPTPAPPANWETFTGKLPGSSSSFGLWTTVPSKRVFQDTPVPTNQIPKVSVYAAKNEFEPFVVVVKPTSTQNLKVSLTDFGDGITYELFKVDYVRVTNPTDYRSSVDFNKPYWPDPVSPYEHDDAVNCPAGQNCQIYILLHIPKTATPGIKTATMTVGSKSVTVQLRVFNFALEYTTHVHSQMNVGMDSILSSYGISGGTAYWTHLNKFKQWLKDHRITPKSPLWPGGLTSKVKPFIDFNCNTMQYSDPHGVWGFDIPAQDWIRGAASDDGHGFPSYMFMSFLNNDASADQRPGSFCGATRTSNDWMKSTTTTYNNKWRQFLKSNYDYLKSKGLEDESYFYFANEPQDQLDFDAVAWYASFIKNAAPDMKVAVSEEPKSQIFNNAKATNVQGKPLIDIWIAHLGEEFDPNVALQRRKSNKEETWEYWLDSTYYPRLNPITLDRDGIEGKLMGWQLWKLGLTGFAYYQFNSWGNNPWNGGAGLAQYGQNGNGFLMYPPQPNHKASKKFVSSVRLEMMRDGVDDYEYFLALNGNNHPEYGKPNKASPHVDKLIEDRSNINRDDEWVYNIRKWVGLVAGGEAAKVPDLHPLPKHSRQNGPPGNYFISFQGANPTNVPELTVGATTYKFNMKIGNQLFNDQDGYGWFPDSKTKDVLKPFQTGGPDDLTSWGLVNDWGRIDLFKILVPIGKYFVVVWTGRNNANSKHYIKVEGQWLFNGVQTGGGQPFFINNLAAPMAVNVRDGELAIQMGKYEEMSYICAVAIVAAGPVDPLPNPGVTGFPAGHEPAAVAKSCGSSDMVITAPDAPGLSSGWQKSGNQWVNLEADHWMKYDASIPGFAVSTNQNPTKYNAKYLMNTNAQDPCQAKNAKKSLTFQKKVNNIWMSVYTAWCCKGINLNEEEGEEMSFAVHTNNLTHDQQSEATSFMNLATISIGAVCALLFVSIVAVIVKMKRTQQQDEQYREMEDCE